MTNTQMHPVKRVITFIMALLMFISSFINYTALPTDAAQTVTNLWFYIGDSGVSTSFQSANWTIGGGWAAAAVFSDDKSISVYDMFNTSGVTVGLTGMYDVFDRINKEGYHYTTLRCKEFSVDGGTSKIDTASYLGSYIDWKEDTVKDGSQTFNSAGGVIWYFYPQWQINTYTVKYNANGGSGTTASQSFQYGEKKALQQNNFTAPAGKKFAGWNLKADGSGTSFSAGQQVQTLTTAHDVTVNLYAQWVDDGYTLTLNGNGGTIDGSSSKSYPIVYGQTYKDAFGDVFPTPVRRGYTFKHYDYNNGAFTLTEDNWETGYGLTTSGTMNAVWTENTQYTLTFDDWGTTSTVDFLDGQQIGDFTTLPTPTRTGYDFLGWYTASSGGTRVTSTYAPDGDTTIYAQWQGKQQTLVLDALAHVNSPSAIQGVRGTFSDGTTKKTVTIRTGQNYDDVDDLTPMPCPTIRGYTFKGWYYNGGLYPVNDNLDWNGKSYGLTSGATFTAAYEGNEQFVLSFDATTNGGTLSGTATYDFLSGQYISDVVDALPTPDAREGYTFTGWYTAATGGEKITDLDTELTKNTTYYAQWKLNPYVLTLNPNGGTFEDGTTANKTYDVYYGDLYQDVVGDMPNPTKAGYVFLGWGVNGGRYDAPDWKADAAFKATSNLTFVAEWTEATYNITFDTNGGTMPSGYTTGPYSIKYKQTIGDAVGGYPIPTLKGSRFVGWKVSYPSINLEYTWTDADGWNNFVYSFVADAVMVAQWEKIPYTLTFDCNDGSLPQTEFTIYYGDAYTDVVSPLVPIPTRERGYRFDGWSLTDGGTTAFWKPNSTDNWDGSTYTTEGDSTVYAIWTKLEAHELSFELYSETTGGSNRAKMPDGYSTKYTIYDGESLKYVVFNGSGYLPVPEPSCPGYTFKYWSIEGLSEEKYNLYAGSEDWNGISYSASAMHGVNGEYGVTLVANWDRNTEYTLTFDLDGGTLSDKFNLDDNYQVEIANGDYYIDIVGGFPVPTKGQYEFAGWKYTAEDGTEYLWETSWDKYPTFGLESDGTLTAYWVVSRVDVVFNAIGIEQTYDYYNDGAYVPVTMEDSDPATVNGSKTVTIKLTPGQTFSTATGYESCPIPTYPGWRFVGWYTAWVDPETNKTRQEIIKAEDWSNVTYNGVATTYFALYACDHSTGLTWHYSNSSIYHANPLVPDYYANGTKPWVEATSTASYFRHHGVCNNCGNLAAFGYDVHFLARNNYGSDILLSYGVPTEDLYSVSNGLLVTTDVGVIVADLLGDGLDPELTIDFNPVLKAAKTDEHFVCWEVDLRKWGYRDANHKNYTIDFTGDTKTITYKFDSTDMSVDGGLHSSHLRLIAGYSDGYKEMVFDSGVSMIPSKVTPISSSIVDSGYRYGVLPIKKGDTYQDVLDYIPVGKQITNYGNYQVLYNFFYDHTEGGVTSRKVANLKYANNRNTLYCTLGWSYQDNVCPGDGVTPGYNVNLGAYDASGNYLFNFILNSSTWGNNAYSLDGDCKVDSYFCSHTADSANNDGIAQGYLVTFFANNKKSSAEYNKAYFNPAEQSGGTMYYKYEKQSSGLWECEPLFVYDPIKDYTNAKKLYPKDTDIGYTDPEGVEVANAGAGNVQYFEAEDDFDYEDYTSGTTLIIAKEPKRYTYYMGEGSHYVFPTPVNDPEGTAYIAYDGEYDFSSGGEYKDPQLRDSLIALEESSATSEETGRQYGDVFYNDINVIDTTSASKGQGNFRLSRNKNGMPVANIYTVHGTWDNFLSGTDISSLPLGYPNGRYYDDATAADRNVLYTGVFPYGSLGTMFLTSKDYEDYGTTYGGGLALTYPEGTDCTLYGQGDLLTSTEGKVNQDLQASYYIQWDYMCKFVSNFPDGQEATDMGYPAAADEQIKNIYGTDDPAEYYNEDSDGNYFVYNFVRVLDSTPVMTNKLFTCEDYIIKSWRLYDIDANGDLVATDVYVDAMIDSGDYRFWNEQYDTNGQKKNYELSEYLANTLASRPGACFVAQWEKAINFTVVDGDPTGGTTNKFAHIEYYDAYTHDKITDDISVTTTVKTLFGKTAKASVLTDGYENGYTFAYITRNNVFDDGTNDLKLLADRIVSTTPTFSTTMVADTAITMQFVEEGTTDRFYLDTNNKLLAGNSENTWVVYNDATTAPHITANDPSSDTSAKASYRLYTESDTNYSVTVSGSTGMDGTYSMKYNEHLTLVTDPTGFVGWKVTTGVDSTSGFISYDPVFEYRVASCSAETITAVYVTEEQKPSVFIENELDDKNANDTFVARYCAPEGYELIEMGYVFSRSSLEAKKENINNPAYYRVVTTDKARDGVFKLLADHAATTNKVFAYAYYKDADGEIHLCMSAVATR